MSNPDEILALTPNTKTLQEAQREAVERFRVKVAHAERVRIADLALAKSTACADAFCHAEASILRNFAAALKKDQS